MRKSSDTLWLRRRKHGPLTLRTLANLQITWATTSKYNFWRTCSSEGSTFIAVGWKKQHVWCRFYTPPTCNRKPGVTHADVSAAVRSVGVNATEDSEQPFIFGRICPALIDDIMWAKSAKRQPRLPLPEIAITHFCEHDFSYPEFFDFTQPGSAHYGGMRRCPCTLNTEKRTQRQGNFPCIAWWKEKKKKKPTPPRCWDAV